MKKVILISFMLIQTICFGQNVSSTPTKLSIISLIANAESYIEKKVMLKGFLNLEKHDTSIYLSKEDYINFNTKNAIFLSLSIDDMNRLEIGKMSKKYVSIIGVFYIPKFKNSQIQDNYIGILKDIEHVELIDKRKIK
ncbi:hypothetical protein [Chryseobacterium cucumeris]|uniref:hypothetical protein n=1 Tax=Chryseobacterium cucumeris TaxID=1813611 RepID=UPI001F4B42DF|nr:hypothetical protein [Chryseobacterium cucumeris]